MMTRPLGFGVLAVTAIALASAPSALADRGAPPNRPAIVVISVGAGGSSVIAEQIEDAVIAAALPGLEANGFTIFGKSSLGRRGALHKLDYDLGLSRTKRAGEIEELSKTYKAGVTALVDVTAYEMPGGTPYARIDVIAKDGSLCATKELAPCGATWVKVFEHAKTVGKQLGTLGKDGGWEDCDQLRAADAKPTARYRAISGATPVRGAQGNTIVVEQGEELVLDACSSLDPQHDSLIASWEPICPRAAKGGTHPTCLNDVEDGIQGTFRKVFDEVGSYQYRLTVTEAAGSAEPGVKDLTILVQPRPIGDAGHDLLFIAKDRELGACAVDIPQRDDSDASLPFAEGGLVAGPDACVPTTPAGAACWYQEQGPEPIEMSCIDGRRRRDGHDAPATAKRLKHRHEHCTIMNRDRLPPGEYVLALVRRNYVGTAIDRVNILVARRPRIYFDPVNATVGRTWLVRAKVIDDADLQPEVTYSRAALPNLGKAAQQLGWSKGTVDADMRVENYVSGQASVRAQKPGFGMLRITATAKRALANRTVQVARCEEVLIYVSLGRWQLMAGPAFSLTIDPDDKDVLGGVARVVYAFGHYRLFGVGIEGGQFGGDDPKRYLGVTLDMALPIELRGMLIGSRVGVAHNLRRDDSSFAGLGGLTLRLPLMEGVRMEINASYHGLGDGVVIATGLAYQ